MAKNWMDGSGTYFETAVDVVSVDGATPVTLRPGADYDWDGAQWVHTPPDPAEVLATERAGMVVSRFQAKAALMQAGHLPAVETVIAAADAITQLAWAEAVEMRRTSPMIAGLAGAIGLTDADLDDLFRAAALIEA
jgi:hypothetical protein